MFSKVFHEESTQHEVFETTTLPLVTDLLLGRNALLFTYGITNSGKTHTMEGSEGNPGVIKRLLAVVFNSIREYRADSCLFRLNHKNGVEVLVWLRFDIHESFF
jgi:kinesin family protein 23